MENAAFTFEQLLHRTFQDNPDNVGSAPEKAKERVLKVRGSLALVLQRVCVVLVGSSEGWISCV